MAFPTARWFRRAQQLALLGLAAALCLALFDRAAAVGAPSKPVSAIIHAGVLIDGVSPTARRHVSILVSGDRIVGVEDGFVQRPGARVIDQSSRTVLPGLIDCHVHLSFGNYPGDPVANMVLRDDFSDTVSAVRHAEDTLLAGFTTVRDLATWNTRIMVALKQAIASGEVLGPRLLVSGTALSAAGGPGDEAAGLRPEMASLPNWQAGIVNGADDARAKVRALKRAGADVIKIMPSGGVISIDNDPARQLMTDDEISAAVETAHALGMKVAAHAHGKRAIDAAVRLDVDSIEHGTYADAATYAEMRRGGVYLVPTLLAGQMAYEQATSHPEKMLPSSAAKALTIAPRMQANLRAAYMAGVKIAFGSDTFGLSRHGQNAREFRLMVSAGMTPMDAIKAATSAAADLLGIAATSGSVQPGRDADLIAVEGDPLTRIDQLENVVFVMKGGRQIK